MQERNFQHRFKLFLIYLYIIGVSGMLLGHAHFLPGTLLNLGMAIWPLLGLLFFLRVRHTGFSNHLKIVAALMIILVGKFEWDESHAARLNEPQQITTTVRVKTYNLFFKNKHPEKSVAIILDNYPDLLAVQEVTPAWEKQLDVISKMGYPPMYKRSIAMKGTHGMAVYSRYPIVSDTILNDGSGRPVAQFVEVLAGEKRLVIVNTHLASPAAAVEHPEHFWSHYSSSYILRSRQFNEIEMILNTRYRHVAIKVLTGDLNTLPAEPHYRNLLYNWVNIFDATGQHAPSNFPNSSKTGPLITLDYILLRGNVKALGAGVLPGGSSDHLAIWGEIGI